MPDKYAVKCRFCAGTGKMQVPLQPQKLDPSISQQGPQKVLKKCPFCQGSGKTVAYKELDKLARKIYRTQNSQIIAVIDQTVAVRLDKIECGLCRKKKPAVCLVHLQSALKSGTTDQELRIDTHLCEECFKELKLSEEMSLSYRQQQSRVEVPDEVVDKPKTNET